MPRYNAPIGPPVTLRTAMEWFWLGCHRCNHRVATRPAIFMNQFGPDYPLEGIRRRGWCTMCGSFGAYTHTPSHRCATKGDEPYEEERGYYYHLRKLDEAGQRSYVVFDAETRAIRRDGLTIGQALQWAARANGVEISGAGRYDDHAVTLVRDRQVIWSHPAPLDRQETDNHWPKVYGILLRENAIQGRYRAASLDQYRLTSLRLGLLDGKPHATGNEI